MPVLNGRQVAPTLKGIREDHRRRYEWARTRISARRTIGNRQWQILDAGCGVGYGSRILGEAGFKVHAVDEDQSAIDYAKIYYRQENVRYEKSNLDWVDATPYDFVIAFEVIEHLEDPRYFLKRVVANNLIGSVPNQEVIPFDPERQPYHHKHYTPLGIAYLLTECGWALNGLYHQRTKYGEGATIEQGSSGQTMIFEAYRKDRDAE